MRQEMKIDKKLLLPTVKHEITTFIHLIKRETENRKDKRIIMLLTTLYGQRKKAF